MQHFNKWNRSAAKLISVCSRNNNLTASIGTFAGHANCITTTTSTTTASTTVTATDATIPNNNKNSPKNTTRKCAIPSRCIQPTSTHASPSPAHIYIAGNLAESIKSSSASTDTNNDVDDDNNTNNNLMFDYNSALVYPNFLSQQEASALESIALERMKRKRFEKGHWDAVITNYKEVELLPGHLNSSDSDSDSDRSNLFISMQAIERVRNHLEQTHFTCHRPNCCCNNIIGDDHDDDDESISSNKSVTWLNCHAIHLSKNGMLSAHVDSVKFSGDIVAGLSLKSASIMRLRPVDKNQNEGEGEESLIKRTDQETTKGGGFVDMYLPPMSLYVLSGVCRYKYTHEILPSGSCFTFRNSGDGDTMSCPGSAETIQVDRDDRVSIIFRDALL
eukprot:CAMPEP_0176482312 /NCGR_PEP_ID=MMETSP0200_2-20121128/3306_1 /TAXON_ID=947934 /ORGANISM="Chaetoceros sp., Strain GSL56" /LENGTH=389 /DNA_ID=CAMNT_0017878615 /DNA_START=175 /DNA_END=1344 /DNA_ORIENTATION=+